jgi:hypothetical protein
MPGTSPIHEIGDRVAWLEHWKSEAKKGEALRKKHAAGGLSPDTIAEIRRIGEIADHVEAMLAFFKNTFSPATADEFKSWIEQELLPGSVPAEEDLGSVFENTARGVETILNDNAFVRDFLSANTQHLVGQAGGRWHLNASVRSRKFDVCPHLKGLRDALPRLSRASRSDLDDLEQVIGGIVVMAIDPAWVRAQRAAIGAGITEFPGRDETVPTGTGRRANFLHLIASALADGHARLHKVFGDPPGVGDEKRVPAPAVEYGGIQESERQNSLKLHFIRYILGPDVPVDPARPGDVDLLFKQVREIASYALREDRQPYWGGGAAFRTLSTTIKQNLELTDFLLIFPTGSDSEDTVLAQSMFVLLHLHHIFTAIKARRTALPA